MVIKTNELRRLERNRYQKKEIDLVTGSAQSMELKAEERRGVSGDDTYTKHNRSSKMVGMNKLEYGADTNHSTFERRM
jgi:hypothetical protein